MENLREQKGLQIAEQRMVKRLDASTYRVKSQNGKGSYLVVIQNGEYRCECPDWRFRGELANSIEIVEEGDSIKAKPKKWIDREAWVKANSILKTFGFAWLGQGKDSLWLKPSISGQK